MNFSQRTPCVSLSLTFLAVSAFASGVPGTTKVVIRANTRLSEQAFASLGAVRIQDYDDFRVYRVPSAALAKLQATAATLSEPVEVHDEWDSVILRNRSIDTRTAAGNGKVTASGATDALQIYVVQFSSPLTAADEQLLAGWLCRSELQY